MKRYSNLFLRQNIDKEKTLWTYLVFVSWPLVSFTGAILSIGKRHSQIIVILFYGLCGFTFIITNPSIDSTRHIESFKEAANQPFSDFFVLATNLYQQGGEELDLLLPFINYTLSRVTSNISFFFMTLSLLLGWILMKNTKFQYQVFEQNPNSWSFAFLLFFIVISPPINIISFRNYFALLVFIYGVALCIVERKPIYFLIVASSVLIHFSYYLVVSLFIVYLLVGTRNYIYYTLIILSFFFSDLSLPFFENANSDLGDGLTYKVRGYTNTEYLEYVSSIKAERNFVLDNYLQWTVTYFLISLIYVRLTLPIFDKLSEKFYSLCLLIFAFQNFVRDIESISGRISMVFLSFICIFYIYLFSKNSFRFNLFLKISTITIMLLNFVIIFRLTIGYTNFLVLTPFLPVSLFTDLDFQILDIFK